MPMRTPPPACVEAIGNESATTLATMNLRITGISFSAWVTTWPAMRRPY
jgi:hypothetical protein